MALTRRRYRGLTKVLIVGAVLTVCPLTNSAQSKAEKRANKACAEHRDWPQKACELIGERRVAIGMSSQMVLAAWGKPLHVNKTLLANMVKEQWVYRHEIPITHAVKERYVYLENDVVTAVQKDD
jgi:hypothetical protein